jgi:hypothetical protein
MAPLVVEVIVGIHSESARNRAGLQGRKVWGERQRERERERER